MCLRKSGKSTPPLQVLVVNVPGTILALMGNILVCTRDSARQIETALFGITHTSIISCCNLFTFMRYLKERDGMVAPVFAAITLGLVNHAEHVTAVAPILSVNECFQP